MRSVYRIFGKGLLTVLPIMITLYLLIWIATRAESLFGEPLQSVLPDALYIPGLGVAVALVLIFLVGLLLNNYLASRMMLWLEEAFENLPVIKTIYSPLRDVVNIFGRSDSGAIKRVVLVDIEHLGLKAVGLITRDRFDEFPQGAIPADHVAVLFTLSYMVGGVTLVVPKRCVREIDMAPEKAMQMALTAWIKSEKSPRMGNS